MKGRKEGATPLHNRSRSTAVSFQPAPRSANVVVSVSVIWNCQKPNSRYAVRHAPAEVGTELESIERAAGSGGAHHAHVGIDHSRADIGVAEQFLNRTDVFAIFQ